MLLAIAPVSSFAVYAKVLISEAEVTFRTDIAGLGIDDYKKIIKINSDCLEFDDKEDDVIYAYVIDEDGDESDSRQESDDRFEAGKDYAFYIYFAAADGFALPESEDDMRLKLNSNSELTDIETDICTYVDSNGTTIVYYEISFDATVSEPDGFFAKLLNSITSFFAAIIDFFKGIFIRKK